MRRRYVLAFIAFALSALTGYMVAASATASSPAYADTSKEYGIGYEVVLQYNNQNIMVASTNASLSAGPRVGGVSVVANMAYQGLANNYEFNGSANGSSGVIVQPPPETVTQTQTYTYTVTKTVTLPSGETKVATEVRTVSVPQPGPGHPGRKAVLAGLGLVALLLLLLARR